eukprot:CAMPEP_0184012612 /NCGR_PEP_ID=MMETSP0954-20121128/4522_1 /TAXON_ID=627963 /ORGANISM="Aplanochytrium sp, Strain PBS07" /LENGTH=371 /DNA_ID=CAMNT_0026292645 /DNA_START=129 /DNA_END=1244 /DNA_ORIENTATION=-
MAMSANKKLFETARKLPKSELHLHLDGSLPASFIVKRARVRGVKLMPPLTAKENSSDTEAAHNLRTAIHRMKLDSIKTGNKQSAGGNWPVFDFCNQFLQTTEELDEAVTLLCSNLVEENVRYAEIRFCPELHTLEGLDSCKVVSTVCTAFQKFSSKYAYDDTRRFHGGIILCALRSKPLQHAIDMANLASKYMSKGVVGFDIAGDEGNYPLENFTEALDVCLNANIPVTVHAGEWLSENCSYTGGSRKNLQFALRHKAIKRIGHGIELVSCQNLLEECERKNVTVECCITSNIREDKVPHFEDHPIRAMFDNSIPVCLNSDNLLLSGSVDNVASSSNEIVRLVSHLSFSWQDVRKVLLHGIEGRKGGLQEM